MLGKVPEYALVVLEGLLVAVAAKHPLQGTTSTRLLPKAPPMSTKRSANGEVAPTRATPNTYLRVIVCATS